MTPKRKGRPPIPPASRLSQMVAVHATRDEVDLLYRIARQQREPASAILRACLLRVISASSSLLR